MNTGVKIVSIDYEVAENVVTNGELTKILDTSDDNNNGEKCSHSWETATCTSPKNCSLCGETEGSALGHTTTTGVCDRCNIRQGWSENEVQSLIKIYDIFVSDINTLKQIKTNFPQALAVDMESTAISQICFLYNVDFLALRIISDTPGIENHYEQYWDFWNKAPEKSVETIKKIIAKLA